MGLGSTTLGGEFLVNTYTTGYQFDAKVAALDDGGYVIVWSSFEEDLDGYAVISQRYDADGQAVGGAVQVNTETAGNQLEATVTGLTFGGYVVTWTSEDQDGSGDGVFGQMYDAAGVASGVEFQVNSYTASGQADSSVAPLPNGGFIVTWSSWVQATGTWDVYAQPYSPVGTPLGAEFLVNTETSGTQDAPTTALLTGGDIVVAWTSHFQDGSYSGIYGQFFDGAGAQGLEFQINTHTDNFQKNPSITALSNGGFVVTWLSIEQDGDGYGIYAQKFDANGATVGSEFLVNTETAGDQRYPDVASLADGGFVIVWESYDAAPFEAGGKGIFAQRYDADAQTVGDEFLVNTEISGEQLTPTVAGLENGGYVITWHSWGVSGDNDSYGVKTQQYAAELFGTAGGDTIIDDIGANWINGQGGDDILKGKAGADKIYGKAGADMLYGGSGNDRVYGGGGDDVLFGGGGKDTLEGGLNDDTLSGGASRDTLIGGTGADIFVFNVASDSGMNTADTITDFEIGVDHIDLVAFGATYIGSTAFSGAIEVRVTGNGTDTTVRVDTDGDGNADMKILVDGVIGLTAGDFLL